MKSEEPFLSLAIIATASALVIFPSGLNVPFSYPLIYPPFDTASPGTIYVVLLSSLSFSFAVIVIVSCAINSLYSETLKFPSLSAVVFPIVFPFESFTVTSASFPASLPSTDFVPAKAFVITTFFDSSFLFSFI